MTRPPLRLALPARLQERAEADAARRGLDLPSWAVETLDAHLAGCECRHAARVSERPGAPEPAED